MKRFFAFALALVMSASIQLFATNFAVLLGSGNNSSETKSRMVSTNGRVLLNNTSHEGFVVEWEGKEYEIQMRGNRQSLAAATAPTAKRMHKPLVITKELDKYFVVLSLNGMFEFSTKEQAMAKAKELGRSTPLLLEITKQGSSMSLQKIEW